MREINHALGLFIKFERMAFKHHLNIGHRFASIQDTKTWVTLLFIMHNKTEILQFRETQSFTW